MGLRRPHKNAAKGRHRHMPASCLAHHAEPAVSSFCPLGHKHLHARKHSNGLHTALRHCCRFLRLHNNRDSLLSISHHTTMRQASSLAPGVGCSTAAKSTPGASSGCGQCTNMRQNTSTLTKQQHSEWRDTTAQHCCASAQQVSTKRKQPRKLATCCASAQGP